MKTVLRTSIAALAALASFPAFAGSFDAPAGLQLYSLRSQFKLRGVAWTLDKVKEMGIVEVELASGVPDLAAEPMRAEAGQAWAEGRGAAPWLRTLEERPR